MHIQVPHPVPRNRKTQCLGQYISKFPISLPNNRKTQCVVQDPNIEFFYCSVGGGELRYVLTQTLSFSIARYGMGNLEMHKPKHLVFLVLGTG
jgi:hypothetical protein